jgi:tRNA A-37 threonylcarbamoyl transferase component Bud32
VNKKIAVLISGDYREFEIAHKSWKFVGNPNVDFYFSTWEQTKQVNENLGIYIKETVSEDIIRKFLPNCKGIDIGSTLIEDSLDTNGSKMINRWKTAVRLLRDSGFIYDVCIIIRPDLFLDYNSHVFNKWLDKVEDGVLYTLSSNTTITYLIQDMIIIGNQNTVTKIESLSEYSIKHPYDIHYWLAKNLSGIFNRIEKIDGIGDGEYEVVRPNCRNSSVINLSTVKINLLKWNRKLYSTDDVIKEFVGFSGSKVLLIRSLDDFIIRKINNIKRNYDKMLLLKDNNFLVPKIIDKEDNILDMEYIQGMDMKTYLKLEQVDRFIQFVITTINRFMSINSVVKNYETIYTDQLHWMSSHTEIPFAAHELIERLPKELHSSLCHGDFTLDNIIYKEPDFYMIDPSTGAYDSWIFDIAKLRQDLDGKWFLRYKENKEEFNLELQQIKEKLQKEFPIAFNDYLYILMLLRVYKYSKKDTVEQRLLLEEIKRLWK